MKSTRRRDGRPIKVMHVIERLPMGGAEGLLLLLARHIDRSRFALTFCCLGDGGPIADRLRHEGLPVIVARRRRLRHFHRKIGEISRLMRRERVDVVHTHMGYADLWGRLCAHLARVPVVVKTDHAMVAVVMGAGVLGSCRQVADRWLDRLTDCVVYVSEAQRQRRGRHGPGRQVVIHNAVDEEGFHFNGCRTAVRSRYGFTDDVVVVGSVGRLVPHKGHEYLLRAVSEVSRVHPRVKVLLVGTGPEEPRLREMAGGLRVDVVFCGLREDVPELMSAMDVFIQPSLREAFGIAVVEAMFAGLPVIATGVGGIPEIVEHGRTGLIVLPADVEALAEALTALIDDPQAARHMAERGRAAARARFGGDRYARAMEELYVTLLDEKMKRRGRGGGISNLSAGTASVKAP